MVNSSRDGEDWEPPARLGSPAVCTGAGHCKCVCVCVCVLCCVVPCSAVPATKPTIPVFV